ncbi:MAG: hypothetical protein PHI12_11910 [Dehalococcoidales bacterium]|nr:hypothetical protein [Dehalococcoidales bacterium]
MNFTDQHRDRFLALLDTFGCATDVKERLWRDIEAAYQEPHRHYHTAQHIIECLELFDAYCANNLPNRMVEDWRQKIEAAIWWHDIVYQINFKAISNERLSAAYAFWTTYHDSHEVHLFISALIMATDHTTELRKNQDTHFTDIIADIDLAILGAEPKRFAEYESQIALEYQHVPMAQYREARARFLQYLLDRPKIYRTDYFHDCFEAKARENLTALVEHLNIPPRRINYEEYKGAELVFVGKDVSIFHSRDGKNGSIRLLEKADAILECTGADALVVPPRPKGFERGDFLVVSAKNIAVEPGGYLYFVFFPHNKDNDMYRSVADLLPSMPNLRVVKDRHGDWTRALDDDFLKGQP